MTTSSTSFNDLASESMAHIFAFLPPDERVRLERVCRKWRQVAKKYAWSDFRALMLMLKRGRMELAKYRTLIDRSGPHLRELHFVGRVEYNMEQWTQMRNLRHVRFEAYVGSGTLRAVAENLTRLQSVHFYDIDYRCKTGMHNLLRADNVSLQALRFPVFNNSRGSLQLPALPSSLRSLHISDGSSSPYSNTRSEERKRSRIDELIELATSCCPQLAMLMLPMDFATSEKSLAKIASLEKLFYLRIHFDHFFSNRFGNSLAMIGPRLRALLLGKVDSRVLHLIAMHCPQLEHVSFRISFYHPPAEELLSALQSVFKLANLRSVSIGCEYCYCNESTQVLATINALGAKGNLEYLYLHWGLALSIEFIINMIQHNPNLRKLTCMFRPNHTLAELDILKKLLQNMDGPLLELELFGHCPLKLNTGENSRVRVRKTDHSPESISQPVLRQFWARAMDSVPNLGKLDD